MNETADNFVWARRLGCPPSLCTESTKKTLFQGIASLLWDHISDKLYPAPEVTEARQIILLYKLNREQKDNDVQIIEGLMKLREKKSAVQEQISTAEEACEKQNLSLCQKRQRLLEIKAARESLKAKKQLLLVKHDQLQTQIEDCKQMHQICQCLMPSTGDRVDQKTIEECLKLVSSLTLSNDKKMVWNKVSEVLCPIAVSTLWNTLLQNRTVDTDRVINLGTETSLTHASSTYGEKFEIGIAKACSQHVKSVSKRILHNAKATKIQHRVMEYIDAIEINAPKYDLDISEWLTLSLELRKYESEQASLENEIKSVASTLEIRNVLNAELNQIAGDMQNIDHEMRQCAQDIQTSLALLKSAGDTLDNIKFKMLGGLEKFAILRLKEPDRNWMNINLNTEIENFYERVDINALKKIALRGDVRAYRHASHCISQVALANSALINARNSDDSTFIQPPLYQLLDCYKHLQRRVWYANEKLRFEGVDLQSNINNDFERQWCLMTDKTNICALKELLDHIETSCQNTLKDFDEFDQIFEAWTNQVVGNILMYDHRTVDGSTFKEWHYRFNHVLSLLASKSKALKSSVSG